MIILIEFMNYSKQTKNVLKNKYHKCIFQPPNKKGASLLLLVFSKSTVMLPNRQMTPSSIESLSITTLKVDGTTKEMGFPATCYSISLQHINNEAREKSEF